MGYGSDEHGQWKPTRQFSFKIQHFFFFDIQLSFKEGAENVVLKGRVATVARV